MENPPDVSFMCIGYSFGYPSGTPGLPTQTVPTRSYFDFNCSSELSIIITDYIAPGINYSAYCSPFCLVTVDIKAEKAIS
jgi:hypothetical protein